MLQAVPPTTGDSTEIDRIASVERGVVDTETNVLAIYLFGSRATGEAHAGSDTDLGVLYRERVDLGETIRLQARFERAFGGKVDLVDAGRARPFLALDLVRGERIFCRDEDATDAFDLYVLRRAGDLEPFERERRRMLLSPEGAR